MEPTERSMPANVASFRSGVAARLAGVPVETLRVWERRYGVIRPHKSEGGQRLYSANDVRRLTLIKQLLDLGHPIGAVATLPDDALMKMLAEFGSGRALERVAGNSTPLALRVAFVGPVVSTRRFCETLLRNTSGRLPDVTVSGHAMSALEASTALRGLAADLVIIELPTLNARSLATVLEVIGSCDADRAIVLYRFAPSSVIRALREAGHQVMRAPTDIDELATLCQALMQQPIARDPAAQDTPTPQHVLPPRFDESSLRAFAEASSTVYCECPRHLVELVVSLTTFERYSAECVGRSPEDDALHRDLQYTAAQARVLMEEAIVRVAVKEGLPIYPSSLTT